MPSVPPFFFAVRGCNARFGQRECLQQRPTRSLPTPAWSKARRRAFSRTGHVSKRVERVKVRVVAIRARCEISRYGQWTEEATQKKERVAGFPNALPSGRASERSSQYQSRPNVPTLASASGHKAEMKVLSAWLRAWWTERTGPKMRTNVSGLVEARVFVRWDRRRESGVGQDKHRLVSPVLIVTASASRYSSVGPGGAHGFPPTRGETRRDETRRDEM